MLTKFGGTQQMTREVEEEEVHIFGSL